MKSSTRVAYLIIILFFIFFNGLQVYLILGRITEAKNKFGHASTTALLTALSDYHKLKAIDSSSAPTNAWISYGPGKIEMSRIDSNSISYHTSLSSLRTDTVEPVFLETIVNSRLFKSIDLKSLDSLFRKSLRSNGVNSDYRLDTILVTGKRFDRHQLQRMWMQKSRKNYAHITGPMRMPYNSSISVFAQVKKDVAFIRKDLLRPMLAFALILIISNAALVFVYRTIRRQKKISELKTDFINNITHEMKTPITIASAGLDALEHHVSPTERTEFYLQTSKKQLILLNEFVERILDAAVQDVSEFSLKKERIDLQILFNEIVQSHSVLQGQNVEFRVTSPGQVFLYGDRLHLETAFHNIIDNAIKYARGSVEITIDIVENNRDCIIRIRDNGMGIQPQFIRNIFDKFFRVPQGDAQTIKGFGLGLYYVHSIVKKHSGNISVQSKWQSGTEFIITLPKHT